MITSQKPLSLLFVALGAFLAIGSLLALILGSSYMLLGLERAPAFYQATILLLSLSSPLVLSGVKLAKGILGAVLLLLSRRLA